MKIRTAITLFLGLFNAAWLCWVFVMLYLNGEMIIPEHNQYMAGFEVALTFIILVMFLERLCNLKEKR